MTGVYRHETRSPILLLRRLPPQFLGRRTIYVGTGGDYLTLSALFSAQAPLPGDTYQLVSDIADNCSLPATCSGISGNPITFDFDGYTLDASQDNGPGITGQALSWLEFKNGVIDGSLDESGLSFWNGWSSHILIELMTLSNNYKNGLYAQCNYLTVRDSEASVNGQSDLYHNVYYIGDNVEILDSVLCDAPFGNGLRGYGSNVFVRRNLIYGNHKHAISWSSDLARAESNHLYEGNVIIIPTTSYSEPCALYVGTSAGATFAGLEAYNNSIYSEEPDACGVMLYNTPSSVYFKNNIIQVPDICIGTMGAIATKDFDHNCYLGNGSNDFYYNAVPQSWSQWQTSIEGEANSLNQDPLFVAGDDLSLQPGSPCRDAGAPILIRNIDVDGVTVPVNDVYDIGAYEYSIVVQYGDLSDSLYMSELTIQLAHYGAALVDSLDMGEGQMPLGNFLSNLGDALGLSEFITQIGHYRGANGDTIIFSDGITATVHYTGSVTDTLTISDSAEALLRAIAAITDVMSFADLTAYVSDNIGVITDILSFSENRTSLRNLIAGNIDAITFAEITIGRGNYTASREDVISLADIVSGLLRLRTSLIDSLTLSDALTIQAIGTLIDNILFSDLRLGTIHFTVALTDHLSLSDQMATLGRYAARLADEMGISDQLSYAFTPVTPEGPILSFTSRGITFSFSGKQ